MSTAAKVFVVLLVLFSVMFSMVTVTFVSLQSNWKDLAMDYRSAYQGAVVKATAVQAMAKTTEVQLQGQIRDFGEQIAELQRKMAASESELKRTDGELADLKNDHEAALADRERATQLQELEKKRADRLETANQELLDKAADLQRRNLDLDKSVRDLTRENAILEEQRRALQEQRYALEQQLETIQKRGGTAAAPVEEAPAAATAEPATPPSAPIRGQIVDVKDKVASISVGSADGVTEGMSFVVYRGSNYLGKLKVTLVEPKGAAGDLTLVRGEIRPKDFVRDERSYGLEP